MTEGVDAMDIYVSLTGPDARALFRRCADMPAFRGRVPSTLSIDHEKEAVDQRWVERILAAGDGWADFGSEAEKLSWSARETVWVGLTDLPRDPMAVLQQFSPLPFELAGIKPIHEGWVDTGRWVATSWGHHHVSFGVGAMIRGDGHQRIVSMRWLEHGPWMIWRGPDDTTLVQFHDLDADSDTALAQATPGHKLLGITDESGYLPKWRFRFKHDLAGLYEAQLRRHKIVVTGRDVSPREMLEACMLRIEPQDESKPIDRVAFVFMEEERARKHLHHLWLRELECWVVVKGQEKRLDEDYRPAPKKPDWVKRLEAKKGRR